MWFTEYGRAAIWSVIWSRIILLALIEERGIWEERRKDRDEEKKGKYERMEREGEKERREKSVCVREERDREDGSDGTPLSHLAN